MDQISSYFNDCSASAPTTRLAHKDCLFLFMGAAVTFRPLPSVNPWGFWEGAEVNLPQGRKT